jgi:UDPglucose 6-dehydrogenase
MKVAIIGTGYVGLTTGVTLAYLGHQVTCLDLDQAKVDALNQGQIPIYEPGLEELLELSRKNLTFTSHYPDAVPQAEVIFIAVGTPARPDGSSDLRYLQGAAEMIGQHIGEHFTVIVNKSTVPIGSGNWVGSIVREALAAKNGKRSSDSFAVVSNPEFLREGSALHDSLYPDRIVVGSDEPRALQQMQELYRPIVEQDFAPPPFARRPESMGAVPLVTADLASAELIKYAANAFLSLKISFINEISSLAERVGADITQVARGIGLDQRIGMRFLQAGLGWGGSCFGKDTSALIATGAEYGVPMSIIQASREVNARQRLKMVDKLASELKVLKGRSIAMLGLAFKPNTDDLRDAPALDIARRLIERGCRVKAHDPIAMDRARKELSGEGIQLENDPYEMVVDADAILLVTEWDEYRELDWNRIKDSVRNRLVIDGRNFLHNEQLAEQGWKVINIGR